MADLIIGKTNVTKLLKEKYKNVLTKQRWVSIIQIPNENHMEVVVETLKVWLNKGEYSGIYITLSKSYEELDKIFRTNGVDTKNLYFIDAISRLYGVKQAKTKKVAYISGPLDIEGISVSLRELLSITESENKVVFLDSVTTMLLYNSLPRTIRFSQFLTETLKQKGISGVIVSVAKGATTQSLLKEISKVCDEIIEIESQKD